MGNKLVAATFGLRLELRRFFKKMLKQVQHGKEKILGFFVLLFSLVAIALAKDEKDNIDDLLKQATNLYHNRHLNPTYLDQSKVLFEKILDKDPTNQEALWQLSMLYKTLGDYAKDKKTKISFYEYGKSLAERLIKINEAHPEGHFWYAVNMGRIGQTRGVINSLFMVPTFKKKLTRTLELDPNHIGAYNAWGVLYYELPSFVGGSIDKAIEWFKKGLKIDPNLSIMYVDLARCYIKKRMYKEAKETLLFVINLKKPTYPADYVLEDKPEAEKLLKKIEEATK